MTPVQDWINLLSPATDTAFPFPFAWRWLLRQRPSELEKDSGAMGRKRPGRDRNIDE